MNAMNILVDITVNGVSMHRAYTIYVDTLSNQKECDTMNGFVRWLAHVNECQKVDRQFFALKWHDKTVLQFNLESSGASMVGPHSYIPSSRGIMGSAMHTTISNNTDSWDVYGYCNTTDHKFLRIYACKVLEGQKLHDRLKQEAVRERQRPESPYNLLK
jgi:hypothetical protein